MPAPGDLPPIEAEIVGSYDDSRADWSPANPSPRRFPWKPLFVAAGFLFVGILLCGSIGVYLLTQSAPAEDITLDGVAGGQYTSVAEAMTARKLDVPPQQLREVERQVKNILSAASQGDSQVFRNYTSARRYAAQVELYTDANKLDWFSKQIVKRQAESYFGQLQSYEHFKLITIAPWRANEIVVYLCAWDNDVTESDPYRYWFVQDEGVWWLYDWENLEVGLSAAAEHAILTEFQDSSTVENYYTFFELRGEAVEKWGNGEQDEARRLVKRMEQLRIHPKLQDVTQLYLAYLLLQFDKGEEAVRAVNAIKNPGVTNGKFDVLMYKHYWDDEYDDMFSAASATLEYLGVSPSAWAYMALAQEELNRRREACATWQMILEVFPDDEYALVNAARMADPPYAPDMLSVIEQTTNRSAALYRLSHVEDLQDPLTFWHLLESYLTESRADTALGHFLKGRQAEWMGELAQAAEHMHQAFGSTNNLEHRDVYWEHYVRLMSTRGRFLELYAAATDPAETLASLWAQRFDYGELDIPLAELS
ncbi:MAG: hypothetical protein KDA60_09790, partial [Planctomycetales bacterium]|nr:hypothetical protein [Planctomycetales bacterium]